MTDAGNDIGEVLERSLFAAVEQDEDLSPRFFASFFARHPEQKAMFFQPEANCPVMTGEILDSLLALAADEGWIRGSIHSLVVAHRCYGDFPLPLYREVLDLFVDTLADMAGNRWTQEYDRVWRQLTDELFTLISHAH